jgi:hypothetical protein
MPLDTITFLEVVLSGFMTIWTFRNFTKSDKKLAEFEWLALSVFWGLVIVGFISYLNSIKPYPNMQQLISNPFAMGLVTSILGIGFGFLGAEIRKIFNYR